MSEIHDNSTTRLLGLLGRFDGPKALVAAAERSREAGFGDVDAFSPFPIHELDAALAIRPSRLPWIVLAAGITGGAVALAGQWWTNAVDYPYLISGKPLFSLPANVPVTFEVVILLAAFAAFFGMLALNGLPRLINPLHRSDQIKRATTDGFFLLIRPDGPEFSAEQARKLLSEAGAETVEECREDVTPAKLPPMVYATLAALAVLALIPPLMVARSRATTSSRPPLRSFKDMDFQPKFKSQTSTPVFEDRRAMRPPVPGTVARGQLEDDDRLYRGLSSPALSADQPSDAVAGSAAAGGFVAAAANDEAANDEAANDEAANDEAADDGPEAGNQAAPAEAAQADGGPAAEPPWTTEIPVSITDELMRRGRVRFNTFCAACHGRAGFGDGPVSVRALELEQGTWVPPTSLHAAHVLDQPVGKLFHSITNGVRKMPGYGDAMTAEDRWAVVLYLRALQRTQAASPDDLRPGELAELRELN